MLKQLPLCLRFVLPFSLLWGVSFAQPTWTLDPFGKEKKPEQYENKKLGSEKTADKKFKLPRRIIQNTVSHYYTRKSYNTHTGHYHRYFHSENGEAQQHTN
mgnify:CR=1 FL=1